PLTDIAQYGEVVAHDAWPGVDVHYLGDQGNLRFDVHVRPGGDIGQVALNYVGAGPMSLDNAGNLILHTPSGDVVQRAPVVYALVPGGTHRAVAASFQLHQGDTVGFQVGPHDPNQELVIDPTVNFSSYLGGSGNDSANAVALDLAGNIYVTGQTFST